MEGGLVGNSKGSILEHIKLDVHCFMGHSKLLHFMTLIILVAYIGMPWLKHLVRNGVWVSFSSLLDDINAVSICQHDVMRCEYQGV